MTTPCNRCLTDEHETSCADCRSKHLDECLPCDLALEMDYRSQYDYERRRDEE